MPYEVKTYKRVEFAETDMAGIVHFSNFFRYMEIAEADFFDKIGFQLVESTNSGFYGWPRIDAACKYKKPAYFKDRLMIHLLIKEVRIRSIQYAFKFYRQEPNNRGETLLAIGKMTTVFAQRRSDQTMVSAALQADLIRKLEEAPPAMIPTIK